MQESDRDFTLTLILKALDLAVSELAELKGISYGEQRHQLLLQATLSQQS